MRSRLMGPWPFAIVIFAMLAPNLPLFAGPAPATAANAQSATRARAVAASFGVPTFADSTKDDVATFDDPLVRQAAVRALGRYNGSVVAIDPSNGRILTIVNQKLAFSAGFIPCSTIKPVIAVAALQEDVVTRETMIRVAPRNYLDLTDAIAHSNNAYFEELGRRMGFDTVSSYAKELGLGELAGYDISEEQAGTVPSEAPKRGGVARMSSFGEGIRVTPLELGALVSTVANGGTLYYLQYPRTPEEQQNFEPRIKRTLDIASQLPDVRDGMLAAVRFGTARRSYSDDEQTLGKTGSCSDASSRIGWFASYADEAQPKLVLVVLMRGQSKDVRGPIAAGIAGNIYRQLHRENYFAKEISESAVSSLASLTYRTSE